MLPIVYVIISPEQALENKYIRMVMDALEIDSIEGFIVPLLGALIVMYILKNAFLLLLVIEQNRFILMNRNKLISQVLRGVSEQTL